MIKTIFWDFDGVILDSMKIKGDGFVKLFKEHDLQLLEKLEKYHYENGGVSRFEKIKYFYNTLLNQNISEIQINNLAEKFSEIIEKNLYSKDNLIEDTLVFIQNNYKKYNFHIVSGAEHKELNDICKYFNLEVYFKTIDGSPTKKELHVKNIIEKYKYIPKESILIGDALTDYNAAIKNDIEFYGYNNLDLSQFNYITSFKEFEI